MSQRVFFYVQHLLGVGHVFRALRIADALREQGFVVDLCLGGSLMPGLDVKGLNVIHLTPLKAGPNGFSDLVTLSGESADQELKTRRCRELLEAFRASAPDVLMVEAFPFARRQMRFELMPLLEAAHARRPRPLVVSSIRDILQEKTAPGRSQETVEILKHYFDHVIVHGAPDFVPLDATFPLAPQVSHMTSYSGLVGPRPSAADGAGLHVADVIVSAGGGAVGRRLLETAILAKPTTAVADSRWLLVTGPNADASDFARFGRLASPHNVQVERFVPDLAGALRHAQLTVSQAGYNTVADIVTAGCKAVLIPYAEKGETEQSRRAALLEERGLAVVISEAELAPDTLAAAIDRAAALPPFAFGRDLGGAQRTGAILIDLLRGRAK